MSQLKHGITASSDPNFVPDPNARHVWDEAKQVWRLVIDKPKKSTKPKKGQ